MGQSRVENILEATIAGSSYTDGPQSRLEALLLQLKEVIEQGGGGTPSASDVSYDNTTSGLTADDVQEAIDEVFQSVSSGKTLVAGAITDKGVTTSASDTFATMATNIAAIPGYADVKRAVIPTDQFANHYIWDIMTPYTSDGGRLYICATAMRDTAYPMVVKKNGTIVNGNKYYTHNGNTLGFWIIDTVENDVISFDNDPHWETGYNKLMCVIIKSTIPSDGPVLDLPNVISLGTVTSWTNPITYTATSDGLLMIYTGDSHTDSRATNVTINGESATFGTIALYEWFNMGHAMTFVFVKNGDVISASYNSSRKYQLLFIPYPS